MELQFQYDKQEVIDALRLHFMNRPEMKLFKGAFVLMIVLAFIGYGMGLVTLKMVIWIFLLSIVLILLFWYILPYTVYRNAKTFREPTISLRWTKDGITIGTKGGESSLPWTRFNQILETKQFFYLYRTNKSFFLIPANAFPDREERVAFSELLQNQFSNYTFK